jgi:hypothetical protein
MAVVNQADDVINHPQAASEVSGGKVHRLVKVISIAQADDDGSIYLVGELPDCAIVDEITIESPAITSASDIDVGLYDVDGTVVDKDCFADGLDLSSTTGLPTGPLGDPIRQCMPALALADANKKVYEVAAHVNKPFPASGETPKRSKYRLCVTGNTVGAANGTLVVRCTYRTHF